MRDVIATVVVGIVLALLFMYLLLSLVFSGWDERAPGTVYIGDERQADGMVVSRFSTEHSNGPGPSRAGR